MEARIQRHGTNGRSLRGRGVTVTEEYDTDIDAERTRPGFETGDGAGLRHGEATAIGAQRMTQRNCKTAWADGTEFPCPEDPFLYFEYTGGYFTTDLVVGMDEIKVGEITVTEAGRDELKVTYETDSGWRMVETGVVVAGYLPVYVEHGAPGVNRATHTVRARGVEFPVCVAAHAVVRGKGGVER